jgi:hypothetical protein
MYRNLHIDELTLPAFNTDNTFCMFVIGMQQMPLTTNHEAAQSNCLPA